MKNKQKILIFGGAGFLGKSLINHIDFKKYDVTVADSKNREIENNNANYVELDITKYEEFTSKLKENYDFIFNLASISDIGEADANFEKAVDVNISGCLNTLKFCSLNKPKNYIYASSMYVFGEKGGIYGTTKKISEMLVEKYAQEYSFNYSLLRYGSLYGPGAHEWNSIIKYVKQIKKDKSLTHWGNGSEVREYIHINDAAKLTIRCLEGEYINKAITITGNQKHTSKEVLEMIFEMLNMPSNINFMDSYDGPHYTYTPYSHVPKSSLKVVPTEYIDFSQGLYDVCAKLEDE